MNGEVPLNYMVLGLTVVGNTVGCLERYFEGESINEYGIYLVRLSLKVSGGMLSSTTSFPL